MMARAAVALTLALTLSGCMFNKKLAPAPAPVPAPARIPAPTASKPPVAQPQLPPAPDLGSAPAPSVTSLPAPVTSTSTAPPPAPAKPKPVSRRPNRAKPVQPPVATSVPASGSPTSPASVTAPRLEEMLTPAQQAEMNHAVDQSTAAARVTLSRLQGHKLTTEQTDTADRIRTFASQAEQARKTDLRSAAQLARRAEVLARDLEASLK
jgi:hypothetical protein